MRIAKGKRLTERDLAEVEKFKKFLARVGELKPTPIKPRALTLQEHAVTMREAHADVYGSEDDTDE